MEQTDRLREKIRKCCNTSVIRTNWQPTLFQINEVQQFRDNTYFISVTVYCIICLILLLSIVFISYSINCSIDG
jgi:hypothetical protein